MKWPGELGPLQYLSSLTGYPMGKIINVLLLIIIFVFDPLAISLVVAANFAFDKAYPKKKYRENLYGEEVELDEEDYPLPNKDLTKAAMKFEVKDAEELKTNKEFMKNLDNLEKIKDWEAAEQRMNIIGQNGNDGEHYSEWDLNQEGKVDIKDRLLMISKLKSLQKEFKGSMKNKLLKLEKEIHNMDVRRK